jgi:hypothetical protein
MIAPHFFKEFKVMLCYLYFFEESILDKSILAPLHWKIHLTIEWICEEFFHHFPFFFFVRRAS